MALIKLVPLNYRTLKNCLGCNEEFDSLRLEEDLKNKLVLCTRCKSTYLVDYERGLLPYSGTAKNFRTKRFLKFIFLAFCLYLTLKLTFYFETSLPTIAYYLIIALTVLYYHICLYSAIRIDYLEFLPKNLKVDIPSNNMQILQIYVPTMVFYLLIIVAIFYS